MDKMQWTILKPATEIWGNRWIKVLSIRVRMPTGVETDFYTLGTPDGVAVLAIDDERNAIVNRQFRPALGEVILELPAGLVEVNEEYDKAATRELAEEAGLYVRDIKCLGKFYRNPARDTGVIHVYFARVAGIIPPQQERYEHMETVRIPLQELITRVLNNEIQDVTTIFGVLMLRDRIERGDIQL